MVIMTSIKEKASAPEDVQVLLELYQLKDFQYHDISIEEKIKQLRQKWPLLKELDASIKSRKEKE